MSNLYYDYHLLGYDKDYIPISLEAIGIPGLRLELSALPAQGKLSVVQRHWSASLIRTMTSMNNYSSQSASYRQEELKKVVHKSFEVRRLRTSHQIRELTLELQNIGDEIIVYVNALRLLVEDNILNEIGMYF